VVSVIANPGPDVSFKQVHKTVWAMILQTGHDHRRCDPRAIYGIVVKKRIGRASSKKKLACGPVGYIVYKQPITCPIIDSEPHSLRCFWIRDDIVNIASPDFGLNAVVEYDMPDVAFWPVFEFQVFEPTPVGFPINDRICASVKRHILNSDKGREHDAALRIRSRSKAGGEIERNWSGQIYGVTRNAGNPRQEPKNPGCG
jgi:hypothetical protein